MVSFPNGGLIIGVLITLVWDSTRKPKYEQHLKSFVLFFGLETPPEHEHWRYDFADETRNHADLPCWCDNAVDMSLRGKWVRPLHKGLEANEIEVFQVWNASSSFPGADPSRPIEITDSQQRPGNVY
jgi:hypothetical protein